MSKFRFHASDGNGELLTTTEWQEEITPMIATAVVEKLRTQYPQAELRIEREHYLPPQKQQFVRFVLTGKSPAGAVEIRYSRPFRESEADAAFSRLQQEYPQAEIHREVWER